jgi:hypothetical protein
MNDSLAALENLDSFERHAAKNENISHPHKFMLLKFTRVTRT